MMDIIDLMGLFDEMDDTHVARVNIEAESITGAKLQLTIGDPEEEAATDPEEETSEKEPEGEKKPEEKKPKLSDAYMKSVWTWLLDYQIKAAELKGRYTPCEVLSWVANDWRKEHERSD